MFIVTEYAALKERICTQRQRILSYRSSSLCYDKSLLSHQVTFLTITIFITHVRNCVMGATPMLLANSLIMKKSES